MKYQQHILIVDDRPENLAVLERVLGQTDAVITAVDSGNDALIATLDQHYALAILDVQMPEMDGYELAELLRCERKTRHLPIIFVSAVYSDDYHVFRGYEAGAVDFLTKPYKPDILLNKVRFFLLLDEQRQELSEKFEVEQSRNYLKSILTCMTDSVVVVSDDDRIQLANRAASELLGYPDGDLIGKPLQTIFMDRELPDSLRQLKDAPVAEMIRMHDAPFADNAGREIPVLLSAARLRDNRSTPLGVVLAAIDNRERKRAEETRKHLESQLRHSQRLESVGHLAGGIAHDFNNMLTIILSYSKFVADELQAGDRMREDVDRIIEAAERAAALIAQLLAFSHKQVLRPEVVDINDTVRTTARMLERVLGEDIELDLSLASDCLLAFVDPGQLTQVLVNLAVNARDAMQLGGTLTVSTAPVTNAAGDGAYVRITVCDTGCGMTRETQERIFEPFFSTKDVGQGTGLGLSVAQGIVEQSGGRLSVLSAPAEGSTFTVDLPCPAGSGVVEEKPTPPPPPRTAGGGTVLIVEDDDSVRRLAIRILQRHGYNVLEAQSPEEARTLAERHQEIDLLLSDVVMPGSSGPELARAIRESRSDLPVLFMSGHAHDMINRHGMLNDETAILQKPFTPNSLIEQIRKTLHGS